MATTHECGHLVGGWVSGGTLHHAELRPWHLPHSLFVPDPRPLVTLWCGPVLGVVVPVGVALVVRSGSVWKRPAWFIADFCLLANGLYLAASWISGDRFLDTPRLLAAGAWPSAIGAYCAVTIGLGYPRFRAQIRGHLL
ncbi:MAG: hypothetical protein K8U03_24370 [Planctomycetia bacterium]|nr:hypothetical protein [Planctomycetia bacterium]